jgi:drug/metabolite transporter (DMT)-like permease
MSTKEDEKIENSEKLIPKEDKEKEEENKKDKSDLQNEPKTYLNCGCFQISVGIIFTYIYIFLSISLNINNRIIYHNYKFQYNFTLMLFQQFFCLILFGYFGSRSKIFTQKTGEISFKDFYKFKFYYLSFGLIFILNILSSFYGNQLVINVSMFVTLRKLVLVMVFFIDYFLYKKQIKPFTILCIFMITIGTILIGSDDFTADYFGYAVVIINNILTIIYVKFSETFKKSTGVTNLKLLVYNSYLANPILIIAIFISGEYKRVMEFFQIKNFEGTYFGFCGFLISSCALCIMLNSSFFISNEKNSSLFTQLLSNSKDIIVSFLSYFFLKDNKLTIKIVVGLFISTTGAILISMKSICDNLIVSKDKKDKEKGNEGTEMETKEEENKK